MAHASEHILYRAPSHAINYELGKGLIPESAQKYWETEVQ